MKPEWESVKELFAACADLDPAARRPLLDAAPGEIRREVESLLAAEQQAEDFLGRPARLGAYQLIEKAGEGGMGTVWKARRADGVFDKQVAVKIIREHFDTAANIERFRAERQILAGLEHPNIARLLDGGTTAGGLPYFVMDLIEGVRIDAYVRQNALSAGQILRLFLPVCQAVDYANRCGVLHRDIKPANILVTPAGVPKLLDFGIAKAIGDGAPATATLYRMATPEYASPEQLTGNPLTPAADVYSLGATLYELLTGVNPYAGIANSLPEMVKAACETEPARPSAVVPSLPAAVDRIIAQAMHKDPRRRYAGAGNLAADIQRHLDSQPVLARADGPVYRLQRLVSRRRAAAVAVFLAAALALSMWRQYRTSRRWDQRLVAVTAIRENSGNPQLAGMDRGVAETLTTSLMQTGTFRVVSADRAMAASEGKAAAEAAKALGADLWVEGDLTARAAKVRLDLRVHETATGRVLFTEGFDAPSIGAVFLLADEAATQISRHLAASVPRRPDAQAALTKSDDALVAYAKGQAAHGRWKLAEAAGEFRRAVAQDPEFAMAWAGIAGISGWFDRPGARGAILRASQIAASRSLPRLPTGIIQGLRLYYDGRFDEAAAVLRALADEFPGEPEPLFWTGMAHAYSFRAGEARAAFDRVTRSDPQHALAWLMLAETSGMTNENADARRAADHYCAIVGESLPNCKGLRGDAQLLAEDFTGAENLYLEGKQAVLAATAAWLRGDLAQSLRLIEHTAEKNPQARLVEGNALAAAGDLAGAVERYERSAAFYRSPALAYLQLLKAAEIWLELGQPDRVLAMTARSSNAFAPGLAAAAHLVKGDRVQADGEFAALRTALPPLIGTHLAAWTEDYLRMLAAFYRKEYDAAAKAAAALPARFRLLSALPAARSLLELGRLEEAAGNLDFAWRARLNQGGPEIFDEQSGLRVALTEFHQARLAARQGRAEQARRWAGAFLQRFSKGAAVLQAEVREARRILSTGGR